MCSLIGDARATLQMSKAVEISAVFKDDSVIEHSACDPEMRMNTPVVFLWRHQSTGGFL